MWRKPEKEEELSYYILPEDIAAATNEYVQEAFQQFGADSKEDLFQKLIFNEKGTNLPTDFIGWLTFNKVKPPSTADGYFPTDKEVTEFLKQNGFTEKQIENLKNFYSQRALQFTHNALNSIFLAQDGPSKSIPLKLQKGSVDIYTDQGKLFLVVTGSSLRRIDQEDNPNLTDQEKSMKHMTMFEITDKGMELKHIKVDDRHVAAMIRYGAKWQEKLQEQQQLEINATSQRDLYHHFGKK